jgi:hypothetical protein
MEIRGDNEIALGVDRTTGALSFPRLFRIAV